MSRVDGALLVLASDPDEICVVAATGDPEACAPYAESVDLLHVAWSSDGRRVVSTQEAARFFVDSDVMVFDRDTGEIENWTDDGYEGDLLLLDDEEVGAPSTFLVDLTPTWTSDASAVVFARTAASDGLSMSTTILYWIDGPGQDPERVAPVGTFPFATYYGIGYAPDGRLLYTSSNSIPDDAANGLYELSDDGRSSRQVAAASEEVGPPALLGATSANSALVVDIHRISQLGSSGVDEVCSHALVDLATTTRTPLRMPDGSCPVFAGVTPDGSAVVLFNPNTLRVGDAQLAVVNPGAPELPSTAIGVDETISIEEDATAFEARGYSGGDDFGLTTTDDGRLFLLVGPKAGALITLSAV